MSLNTATGVLWGSLWMILLDEDVSYQSNADTYFQEMAIRQMLNKNGLFIPEDQGILDGLIAKLTESAQKSE